jgi:PAS domain S-box-containing protein
MKISKTKLLIIITMIFLALSGILFTLWIIDHTDKQLRKELLKIGNLAAKSIDTHQFSELTGSESDLQSLYYRKLKEQLSDMHLSDSNSRFFYLVGLRYDNTVFFLVDSEPINSKDNSPPGQIYSESPTKIKQVFKSGYGDVEGPYTDRWGRWISVFVPVKDRSSGKVLAVLGIDIDAGNWSETIFKNAGVSVGLFFIIIIMVIFVILINRSKQQIKSHQMEIAESGKRFRILFEDSPDANLILIDGLIADCNISTEKLLCENRNLIIGKSLLELSPAFQPDGNRSADIVNEIILKASQNRNHTFDWVYRRFDGENFWVEVSVSSIMLDGKSALFVSWRDVTQRKIAEEEMNELNEQLRISNEIGRASCRERV